MLGKFLGKCLRVLDLLSSNNFSNFPGCQTVTFYWFAVFVSRNLPLLFYFMQELFLSIHDVPGLLPQAEGIVQLRLPWARAYLHGADLPVGEAKISKVTIKQVTSNLVLSGRVNKHT